MFYKLMMNFVSYMYYIISHKISYINSPSSIKKIQKLSIMGTIIDVTLEFTAKEKFIHTLDTWIVFTYLYNGVEYKLGVSPSYYENALYYIENLKDLKVENCTPERIMHSAFLVYSNESNESNEVLPIDITNQVAKYAGPSLNFYTNTPFPTSTRLLLDFEFLNDSSGVDGNGNVAINILEYSKEQGMLLHKDVEALH
ncbi:hypothetical protein CCP3SC1AL1_3520001 [Gammaproteobacteria bacterium]